MCEDNGFAAERQIFPRFSVRRMVCRGGLSGCCVRSGSFGPVFAGRYLPVHLPDVFCRAGCLFGLSLIARLAGALAGRPLIVRLAEGASQSRSCRASLGLADVSEPSGRGGTTMRLFVRRGFGPGRLLTGWFLSGVALVRGGVEPTWLRAGRLRIPRRSYGDATGSPPTRSGRGRRSCWP